jgi:hypothetical protein
VAQGGGIVIQRPLQKLNTQHRAAARLKAEGANIARIHEELGVAISTLHRWFSDHLMKAEVQRLQGRIEDVFVERKATAGLRALTELSELGTKDAGILLAVCKTCGWFGSEPKWHGDPDNKCVGPWDRELVGISEETKITSLVEVLDRVDETTTLRDRAKATEAINSGGSGGAGDGQTNNFIQIFQKMSDEDLAGLLRAWNAKGSDGDAISASGTVVDG